MCVQRQSGRLSSSQHGTDENSESADKTDSEFTGKEIENYMIDDNSNKV